MKLVEQLSDRMKDEYGTKQVFLVDPERVDYTIHNRGQIDECSTSKYLKRILPTVVKQQEKTKRLNRILQV